MEEAEDSGHGSFGQAHLHGWAPPFNGEQPPFDVLWTTALDLMRKLEAGDLSSVELVNVCHDQILTYNRSLKAVYQLCPSALERAAELDRIRAEGNTLGSLHGMPILLNGNIGTKPSLGMTTTGGNLGLEYLTTTKNAVVVDKLIDAGAIILGKTNVSEMMGYKGSSIRPGWSSLHGQTKSPYIDTYIDPEEGVLGHASPGGASCGSAAAVAAGFAPWAIGTESDGSTLVGASVRHTLYSIKPARGSVSSEGIMTACRYLETPGPMCKSVEDAAVLLRAMMDEESEAGYPHDGDYVFSTVLRGSFGWPRIHLGTLNEFNYRLPDTVQKFDHFPWSEVNTYLDMAYARLRSLAETAPKDVDVALNTDFFFRGSDVLLELAVMDFEADFDSYLRDTRGSTVTSLAHLAAWNRANSSRVFTTEHPDQSIIDRAVAEDHPPERRDDIMLHLRKISYSFLQVMNRLEVNVLIAPADTYFAKYGAATGLPCFSLPTTHLAWNGRPTGLVAVARNLAEAFQFLSSFQHSFTRRRPPLAFLDWEDADIAEPMMHMSIY